MAAVEATGRGRNSFTVHPATSLLRDILDLTTEFERHLGRELTVNPTDLAAMEELIRDGALSPTDLSRRLGLTTAAVTTAVDRLTAVGHVTREPNPADRRGVLVVPSPDSVRKAMGTLMPMIVGMDRVLSEFDEDQKETITAYLERVAEVYRDQLPEPAVEQAPASGPATTPVRPAVPRRD